LISRPQYNTWIELTYNQNQADILKYARAIVENGLPPGVLMIDDNWAPYYGNWTFRKDRFPDAKKMMDSLHGMGFKVMVWLCPFISPDSEQFRYLRQKRALLFDNKGDTSLSWKEAKEPVLINWWNGYSAELDFTNPEAVQWFSEQLQSCKQIMVWMVLSWMPVIWNITRPMPYRTRKPHPTSSRSCGGSSGCSFRSTNTAPCGSVAASRW
jgi:alpha-glucosidase